MLGIDTVIAEVLPEDEAARVAGLQADGARVPRDQPILAARAFRSSVTAASGRW